jgi:membrane protease YdiL (CAAX protease family)
MLLFLGGGLWVIAARGLALRAANGLTIRFSLSIFNDLIQQAFLLFLLLWGFATLSWMGTRPPVRDGNGRHYGLLAGNALPSRATTGEEWMRGVAIGWGMVLAALLPMVLVGSLHPQFDFSWENLGLTVVSLLTLALLALTVEITFRGFLFVELIAATSSGFATFFLSFLYATLASLRPDATLFSVLNAFLFGILLCTCYLRTRALWIGWGIHFGWNAVLAVLFGIPLSGDASYSNIVFTSASGPQWLTGGPYGPDAAMLTSVVLLVSIVVILRATRQYAWEYTYTPPAPGGYPMEATPPVGHDPSLAPLVQILSSSPSSPVANPAPPAPPPEAPSSQP